MNVLTILLLIVCGIIAWFIFWNLYYRIGSKISPTISLRLTQSLNYYDKGYRYAEKRGMYGSAYLYKERYEIINAHIKFFKEALQSDKLTGKEKEELRLIWKKYSNHLPISNNRNSSDDLAWIASTGGLEEYFKKAQLEFKVYKQNLVQNIATHYYKLTDNKYPIKLYKENNDYYSNEIYNYSKVKKP
jgi:hypothetical protein